MKRIYEYEDLQPVLEQLLQDRESGEYNIARRTGDYSKAGRKEKNM